MSDQKGYLEWRQDYDLRRRNDKSRYVIKLLIGLSLFFLLYLWHIGELQFIGQPVSYTQAVVIGTGSWKNSPRAEYGTNVHHAKYEYTIENKLYTEEVFPTRTIGRLHKGDTVLIKYSTWFPNLSKVIINMNR